MIGSRIKPRISYIAKTLYEPQLDIYRTHPSNTCCQIEVHLTVFTYQDIIYQDDAESEMSYKKWLGPREGADAPTDEAFDFSQLPEEWKFLSLYKTNRDKQKKQQVRC